MPRKQLGKLTKGQVYTFPAGNTGSGQMNVVFPDTAGPQDQTSLVLTKANGSQTRKDKVPAGATRINTFAVTDIESIQNLGPSQVELSLNY
jgi:hypothetical protein